MCRFAYTYSCFLRLCRVMVEIRTTSVSPLEFYPTACRRSHHLPIKPATGPLSGALRLFRRTQNDEGKEQVGQIHCQSDSGKELGAKILHRSCDLHVSADRPW